jgi:hypothetical protein
MTVKYSTGQLNSLQEKIKADMALSFINIYTGAQPASSDSPMTGTLLATVSIDAGGTGLTFDTPSGTTMSIPSGVNWQYTGIAAGTAGCFRLVSATDTNAQSTTEKRIDGNVGTTSGDMILSNINVVVGAPGTVDIFNIVLS